MVAGLYWWCETHVIVLDWCLHAWDANESHLKLNVLCLWVIFGYCGCGDWCSFVTWSQSATEKCIKIWTIMISKNCVIYFHVGYWHALCGRRCFVQRPLGEASQTHILQPPETPFEAKGFNGLNQFCANHPKIMSSAYNKRLKDFLCQPKTMTVSRDKNYKGKTNYRRW